MSAAVPDIGALYERYKHVMHRVAASALRGAGLLSEVSDVVQDAVVSIISSPPSYEVRNWEAFLVQAVKRKAIDRIRSAPVRHAGDGFDEWVRDRPEDGDLAQDVVDELHRQEQVKLALESLAVLDERHRTAVWATVALGRARADVAAELGVTPPRISQMVKRALKLMREEMTRKEGTSDA
ncbi:sigma-70 family RNA polymerase sigma factor [Zhihengliuella alba]|uniref:sigma-70 family RNA polymerase sigma factor n=1 Tax=Zhihengliuella alba TaxID=547018 RepID=UPI0031EDAD5D